MTDTLVQSPPHDHHTSATAGPSRGQPGRPMPGDGAYLMQHTQQENGLHTNQQQAPNRARRGRGYGTSPGSTRGAPRNGHRGGREGGVGVGMMNGHASSTNGATSNSNPAQTAGSEGVAGSGLLKGLGQSTTNGEMPHPPPTQPHTAQRLLQHESLPHRPQAPATMHGPTNAVPHHQDDSTAQNGVQAGTRGGARSGGKRGPRGQGRGRGVTKGARDTTTPAESTGTSNDISLSTITLDASAPAFSPNPHYVTSNPNYVSAPPSPVIFVPELPVEDPVRTQSDRGKPRNQKSRQPKGQSQSQPKTPDVAPPLPNSRAARRAAFEQGAKLTKTVSASSDSTTTSAKTEQKPHRKSKMEKRLKSDADDLIDRLTRGLGKKPFFECPICYNAVTPAQQIWCCLPPDTPPPSDLALGVETKDPKILTAHYQACYTPFHYACVRDWSRQNLEQDAQRLRAIDSHDEPVWRCPGCQKRRPDRIPGYR